MVPIDPNIQNYPILSYVMDKIPTLTRSLTADYDVENPRPPDRKQPEPHFELAERMPHLRNPKLISAMRHAVSDVAQTRSVLQALGTRPDHEIVDAARFRLTEINAYTEKSEELNKEYKTLKTVIAMDEMHEAYGRMLGDAEKRLERIYEAAVAGLDQVVEDDPKKDLGPMSEVKEMEMNEDVLRILKEAEFGRFEKVDLSKRRLRELPEAFGQLKYLVILNLSNNQLEGIPESISGLENLEELNLSTNVLETLPDSFKTLYNLKILDVSGNNLSALPDGVTRIRALEELNASFNKLTYLPTNFGYELVNLKKLWLYLNKLRSLPSSIGDMKALQILDVHFNELHGLPSSIGRLSNLEILNISSNFSDMTELPESVSDLSNLKELDLSNNQIHKLPDTFGKMLYLEKLNLDENPIKIPPKDTIRKGVDAVKVYMAKRWGEMMLAEEKRRLAEMQDKSAQTGGILTRSTSWLNSMVTNVSGTVTDYLGNMGKTEADRHLDKEY